MPPARKSRQPYFFFDPTDPVIAFAGLWNTWTPRDSDPQLTCALLSRQGLIRPVPASITGCRWCWTPPSRQPWLDPDLSPADIQELIATSRDNLLFHPVTTRVNSVKTDTEDLLNPVEVFPNSLFPPE